MTQEELDTMRQKPGLYILTHSSHPRYTMPILSVREKCGEPAKLYALEARYEIERKADCYDPRMTLAGGPFTAQTLDVLEDKLQRMLDEIEFWKGIALDARHSIELERDLSAIGSKSRGELQSLLDQIEDAEKAQAVADELTQQPA